MDLRPQTIKKRRKSTATRAGANQQHPHHSQKACHICQICALQESLLDVRAAGTVSSKETSVKPERYNSITIRN
jgi:hypothetical protein